MEIKWLINTCVALLVITAVIQVDGKRTLSLGRSRKKPANINVRRSNSGVQSAKPNTGAQFDYSGQGVPYKPASKFDAPPPYSSVARGNPPSYAEATGGANYPRQTYSAPIGHSPPYGSYSGMGSAQNSPQQGLYAGAPAMAGGGIGPSGYGSGYGHGSSSSPFSFGNVLAGLAVWNLARGFNSHGRTEHVYIHRDQDSTAAQSPDVTIPTNAATMQATSTEEPFQDAAGHQLPQIDMEEENRRWHSSVVEQTTDHPSLWIYAINTKPIRTEVLVADRSSYL